MPGIIPDAQLRKMNLGLPTGYVFHERYLWHDPGELAFDDWMQPCRHWDHPETKRRMHNLICASGLIDKLKSVPPREATEAELCYFHTPEYVRRVKALSAENGGEVGNETAIKKGGYSIAALAAGGAIAAVDEVMSGACANAYAMVRPPGHHATKAAGGGFCVFNNVVVAAEHAFRRWGDQVKRIAIMDFDAHHGNGTQEAFERDGRVLLVDVHQSNNYPIGSGAVTECGSGEGADLTINVALPAGSGSAAYALVMHRVVVPAFMAFKPDLIIASCGFDASYMDPLARLNLGSKDFVDITKTLLIQADIHSEGRLVMVQEGGYSEVYVPFCGLAVVEALSGKSTEVQDPMLSEQQQQDGRYEAHQDAAVEAASEVANRLADRLESTMVGGNSAYGPLLL